MLMPRLCDYSDTYILISETITITGEGDNDAAKQVDGTEKVVIFNNYVLFIVWLNN